MLSADRCVTVTWRRSITAGVLAVFAMGLAVPPAAAVNRKVSYACKFDYKRLCPRYRVGSSKMRACMEAKQSEISSRCIDALIDSGEADRRQRGRR